MKKVRFIDVEGVDPKKAYTLYEKAEELGEENLIEQAREMFDLAEGNDYMVGIIVLTTQTRSGVILMPIYSYFDKYVEV